jgi:RHS repeat-associated protein
MTPSVQQAPRDGSCQSSCSVIWSAQTAPEYPQAPYYRARYYDPAAGRFLSEDPVGFNGGLDFYTYVANSSANLVDPSGQQIAIRGDYTSWVTALAYLCSSPAACAIIDDLEKSPFLYVVNVSDTYTSDTTINGVAVFWNPHMALCVKNGVESPAISLLHELVHLRQREHHQTRNTEEGAVRMTNPAANQLGEPTRLNYSDAQGHSKWPLPIPISKKQQCQCEAPKK